MKHHSKKYYAVKELLLALNDANIARKVKVTREYVSQVRDELGVPSSYKWERSCVKLTEEKMAQVYNLLKEEPYLTNIEIGRRVGLSGIMVSTIIKTSRKTIRNLDKFYKVRDLYYQGYNANQICDIVKMCYPQVYHWINFLKTFSKV